MDTKNDSSLIKGTEVSSFIEPDLQVVTLNGAPIEADSDRCYWQEKDG